MDFVFRLEIAIPELVKVGEHIVEAIDRVEQALQQAKDRLATELPQIAEAIRSTVDPTRLNAIADQLDQLGTDIGNIIPDASPPPSP